MLLLSVDPDYFPDDDDYLNRAEQILGDRALDWLNVFLPGGWGEAQRTFNVSGYGKLLVDPHGVVRGVNLHGADLERLVRQIAVETAKADELK
ncbi:MAG: hypothetical protein WD278_13740 [Pirellulales bacterium]